MNWKTLWSLALVGVMVTGCGGGGSESANDSSERVALDRGDPNGACAHLSAHFTQLLSLTNEARAEKQAPPLRFSLQLGKSAQSYAEDLATERFLSHTGKDGSTFISRIAATGYQSAGVGENIGGGFKTAQGIFDAWMNSDSHRANLLSESFSEVGFGVYDATEQPSLGRYWVQHLGKPQTQPSAEGAYIPYECGAAIENDAIGESTMPGAVAGLSNLTSSPTGVDHSALPPSNFGHTSSGTLPVNLLAVQAADVVSSESASVPEPAIALGLGTLGLALWRDHKNKVKKYKRHASKK